MKVVLPFLMAAAPLLAQVVEGTVINSATRLPAPGVTITIESTARTAFETTSDDRGAFRFEGVPPGLYTAAFSDSGFLPPAPDSPARRPFRIAAGSDPVRLQALLTPLGKIMGRVFDAMDRPIAGGQLLLENSRSAMTRTTDAQGNFSFQAPPGAYLLSAGPPGDMKPPPAAADEERLGWIRTYYPGVTDARGAVKITLHAGSELWGQDIRIVAAPVRRLRGTLADANGDPTPHVAIHLGRAEGVAPEDIHTESAEDGSFEFPSLHEGDWSLTAQAERGGANLRAFALVTVAGRDVDRIELRLVAPFTVTGAVTLPQAAERRNLRQATVLLRPSMVAPDGLRQVAIKDGAFQIDNVYPGLYKIIALPPGAPYFVSSIKLGGVDALGRYVQISSGSLPIEIDFDSAGGAVHGTVEDCGSATVVLAPQEPSLQDPQFVLTSRCRESGRYEITDVRPGTYYAFALDQWEGPADLLANLDQSIASKAVTIRIEAGQTASQDLRVSALNR